ncbi:hypothetical protein fugu_000625 [Takifugu bimaculatus]|uniref:CENPJ tubulin-binding region domain-containing protein n=1 Tax=Takifugu bimaculatus TaxID=433685 RepID=A0A4Z2CH85_9TELE|nr:hypothetical protein fugu_000625 [Takifugu bimaculatus]
MPNSSRAGVILAPCAGVSSAPRLPSAEGPNDSFVSDFGPLPASADSSCVAADGCPRPPGGGTAGSDGPLKGRSPDGELDSLDPMERPKQPPTLTMKLEQLRKWQEHMQEQLQAQQLEELLRLQEEQQRLLGKMNGSQDYDAGSTQSEEYDDEDRSLSYQQSDILPPNNEALTEDCTRGEDKACNDRPIKGQKKTFEELLEEQLKLEEQRLKSAEQQSQTGADTLEAPPKRAFLKRGEGLSRFTNRRSSSSKTEDAKDPKPGVLAKVISRSNSEPAGHPERQAKLRLSGFLSSVKPPHSTRKTAREGSVHHLSKSAVTTEGRGQRFWAVTKDRTQTGLRHFRRTREPFRTNRRVHGKERSGKKVK